MYSIHQRLHFFFSVDSYYILRSFNFWMVQNSINLSGKLYLSELHQLDFDENWNWDFGINLNQLEWDYDESLITVSEFSKRDLYNRIILLFWDLILRRNQHSSPQWRHALFLEKVKISFHEIVHVGIEKSRTIHFTSEYYHH